MIVFDASTLVGAALKVEGVPEQAFLKGIETDTLALSVDIAAEVQEVLGRAKFARSISAERRQVFLR